MVSAWAISLFIAGLALVAIELAYPRRYLGVLGLVASVCGLVAMVVPEPGRPAGIGVVLLAALLTAAVAVPFYRRYAPHVGPLVVPDVGAGDLATVEETIRPERDGLVRAGGILWSARADKAIAAGARVRILVIESDRLWVEEESDAPSLDDGDRDQDPRRETPR